MADLNALYQQYLGRAPDPSGISTWSGQDEASIIAGILGSQEYQQNQGGGGGGEQQLAAPQNNTQVINQLYKDILGREADPGSAGWVTLLDAGYTPDQVAREIGASEEARNKLASSVTPGLLYNDPYNFSGSITQLYASALGRLPDSPTLEADLNLLRQNPDAFQWIAKNVTESPEAQAYAQKTGINLENAYTGAIQNYANFTPSPEQGGIGGFFNRYGQYLPYLAAAAMTAGAAGVYGAGAAGAAEAGAAGAGAAAGGAGAAAGGAGGAGALTTAEILGGAGGAFVPAAGSGASFVIPAGATYGIGAGAGSYLTPELMGPTYGELGYTGLEAGQMGPTYAELGYTGLNQGEAIAAADAAAATYGATGIDSLLSSLGSTLKTPLGQLGVKGGLGLLAGGGQQTATPQVQAGSGTYTPKGQVDYTPILNLLAPRQIARNTNSLLG